MKFASSLILALILSASDSVAYDSVVVINEIQYNPPAGQTEWLELRNNQGVDVNLAGWQLTGGISYTFPDSGAGSVIPGGGYLVIAANPALVAGSIGPFTGSLNNAGDVIRLRNLNGRIMDEVNYDDEGDWPVGADGSGATLARKAQGAESGPAAWIASTEIGGTPMAVNLPEVAPPTRTTVISLKSAWSLENSGTDLGTAWRNPEFDDTGWTVADADFSFGGGLLYENAAPAESEWGEWNIAPWTGDADSQVSASKTYTHKVDLFHSPSTTSTVINGVTFDGFNAAAAALYTGLNWTLAGAGSSLSTNTGAPRNLMSSGSGSWRMLTEFYYGATGTNNSSTLTVTGLTPGEFYVLTSYCTGWDAREPRKLRVTPSNTGIATIIDEGARGQGGGFLLRYHYKAPASGSLSVSFHALNISPTLYSWHHYGFTNEVATALPQEQVVTGATVTEISSEQPLRGGANVTNGAGLASSTGNHGIVADNAMWLTSGTAISPNDPLPAEITFDLGSAQSLTGVRVWNYNEFSTDLTNRGAKDVEIFTSPDATGETFTSAGTFVFDRATGSTLDVGTRYGFASTLTGVRRVRLSVATNWGDAAGMVGLSEVRFLKPYSYSSNPVPAKSPITSLFNSGVTHAGTVAASGTTDLHWTAVAPPTPYTAALVMAPNAAWVGASAESQFIGLDASGSASIPVGTFDFRTTFDLTGYQSGTEAIFCYTATDNSLAGISVNGAPRGNQAVGHAQFTGPQPIPGPFNAGSNTLDFFLSNQGSAAGPGGLRVKFDAKAVRNPATNLASNPSTTYFRKKFNLAGAPSSTYLINLRHGLDDGAVFYLNGQELYRTNLTGTPTFATPADADTPFPMLSSGINVPSTALITSGENVLAVELHQAAGSADAYFDAELEVLESPQPPSFASQLAFHEISGASDTSFFVELKNTSGAILSTTGWSLMSSTGLNIPLPATTMAAGGFLVLDTATLGTAPTDGTKLYLVGPGGSVLSDAREVTNRLRGIIDGRWGHPSAASPGTNNLATISQDVVINEIFYKSISGPEQWIELHNKGAAPVDVSAWKFTDGISFDFPTAPPAIIPAGGFLVVAWDPAAFSVLHPGKTALGPWDGSLSGGGELITLSDANDNLVDQMRYASDGRWSQWASGGGCSLELKNPNADNSVAEAWDSSDESMATGWETITYSGLGNNATTNASYSYYNELVLGLLDDGEILIDDIVVSELTSGGATRSQLIQNGNFSSGTASTWRNIGTHKFSTVVDDPFAPGNPVLKIVSNGATEHMNNHCETTIKDGATYVALATTSTYTISFRAKWLRGTNRLHSRLYFNRLPKQTLLSRPATGGTPGAPNSRLVANTGPTFTGLSVLPVVPLVNMPANVSIAATDSDGLTAVELLTSINGAAFSASPMAQSGAVWTASIPGQSSGALVQFYIRATDSLGAISTFPAGGPGSRAMIPWEDGRSVQQMPSGARPHNVRVVMPAADANDMYLAENTMSNWYRPCTFIFDDARAYYHAGARLKSSEHGRFQQNRVGFNVKFGGDEPFLGAHTTISIDRSGNASNEGLDGTSITSQREILLKQVMNSAGGIYSQEDDLIRVIPTVAAGIPAPAFTGSGAVGEAILSKSRFDDEYLDGQWDNGGSGGVFKQEYIYPLTQTIHPTTRAISTIAAAGNLDASSEQAKIPETGGSPGPAGIVVQAYAPAATGNPSFSIDPKENYRWHWLIRNARTGDDYSGIISAITAVGQTAGTPAFKTQTEAALEVDTWLRSAAVPMMFMVTDNYLGNGSTHNFILYFPPGQKGIAIPWDCDFLNQTTANATSWSMTAGGNIAKFITDGANKRRYWCHVLDVLDRSFNDAFLTKWATHYAKFGADDVSTSLPVLRLRANYLRDIIMGTNVSGSNAGLTRVIANAPFTISTVGPVTSGTPFTTITGDGWLDIDSIRLQGNPMPMAVTWTDDNSWSIQLPVSAGTNAYVLEALRKDGTVTGTASIQVTGSGGVFPAGPGNLVASEIHFNPAGSTDATEFIEILNITNATLDLTGCHFDDNGQGIAFTFPSNFTMPAGGRALIVRDSAAFSSAYPGAGPVAGVFTGGLDNGGEEVVLFAASGAEIFRFGYSDDLGATDGGGYSLVRVLGCSPNPSEYTWRTSMTLGGNPGDTDAAVFAGNALDDLDGDGHSALIEYAYGTSDNSWNPATDFLVPQGEQEPLTNPLPNADCAIVELESSDDLVNWTSATSGQRKYWRVKVSLR